MILLYLLFWLVSCSSSSAVIKYPWIAYYGDQAPSSVFSGYNPIIFDTKAHPSIALLIAEKKQVLGYIDLAEATSTDSWFSVVKEQGLLIRENPNWPGSWSVDIRNNFWKKLILNEIIPKIFAEEFNGLFYDQLDVALELEIEDPVKYSGMSAAAIDLVKSIHEKFPGKWIMINRSYSILPEVGNAINYVLAETLYTSYDFKNKRYFVRPEAEYLWQLSQLNQARQSFPHLVLFSLDYWDLNDKAMCKKIYAIEQSHCIRPYVTTISLGEITSE